jgi:hypothetical protein
VIGVGKEQVMRHNRLSQIVSHYVANKRERAESERRWFIIQPTLEDAISNAARARKPSGKRFGHQRRIPESVLRQCEIALLESARALQSAQTFEEFHHIVSETIGGIHGVGELMVYDTSLRIAAKLKLEPVVVFLHAGTRLGAKALGLDSSQAYIERRFFPPEFEPLSASEIEDVLCIYKDRLGKGKSKKGTSNCN